MVITIFSAVACCAKTDCHAFYFTTVIMLRKPSGGRHVQPIEPFLCSFADIYVLTFALCKSPQNEILTKLTFLAWEVHGGISRGQFLVHSLHF